MTVEIGERNEAALYGVLAALVGVVFATDLMVPLGMAVWIVYLVPTVLSFLAWRPWVPLLVAAISTLLILFGYLIDRPGIDPSVARFNRITGAATAWVLAGAGYVFIANKLAVRRQEWLQAGQVALAAEMAGELGLDRLGERVLGFLGRHLKAEAGALFAQDGERFVRIASFGVPAGAPVPADVRRGEGLLGEAIAQGHGLALEEVPEGYLYFGSGLGAGRPGHLLIEPIRLDDGVNGVVELGFLRRVPERHGELLRRVSGAIGVALRSAQYRTRLRELLEETQRQAEELQAHGDELSAANEELEEQASALRESQAQLEEQQAELEQTNARLEEQTQVLEAQRDDLARAQGTLRQQARDLETASRYKSEFLANMSHELRTPLNALLIMARLLADNREGNLSEEQVRFARTIETSGSDLLELINDILDISRIEAGRIEIQPEPVAVEPLLAKLAGAFRPLAEDRGLALSSSVAPGTPAGIETDPQRLEQVIKNFLSNAIKFTERGTVALEAAPAADGGVAFTVHDTGIGIAEEDQHLIFHAFRQADGTISRRFGGTGLGLSISRELAELLGGSIALDSTPGAGSAFTLTLPARLDAETAKALAARPAAVPEPVHARSRSGSMADEARPGPPAIADDRERLAADSRVILVVEDDAAFARILGDLAHELGFLFIAAATADDGVLLARQYLPHAVILDMGLPDHSGLTVLDRLKRDTRTRHIPVHVVSVSDYTQTALAYGAVGYMLKPVKREELVEALQQLETRLSQRMRRLLIVEDDPGQLEGLQHLLSALDAEVVGCSTAAECLDRLRLETFDCMVLDMTLPDASGFDVLEELNADESAAFPPVIVYTARELSEEEELRLRRYAKSIIIKGAKSPERLIDEVTLFLHHVVAELPEAERRMLTTSLNRDAVLEGKRILVVEDDVRNVFALTSIFEPHGAVVEIARNGREALAVLERIEAGEAPAVDLVLMDVMMPEMDGLTATREIRSRERWKTLPIIMLTAKAMADDHEHCLAAGANDYVAKPLDVDKLLSLTRVWMPR